LSPGNALYWAYTIYDDGKLEDNAINNWDEHTTTDKVYASVVVNGELIEEEWD
jgi:phage terminase large subunit